MIAYVLAAALAAAPPTDAAAPRELTLEEALSIAAKSQPQLAQARALIEAARARAGQVRAGYLPRVDAQASYGRGTNNIVSRTTVDPATGRRIPGPTWQTTGEWFFGATLTQLIWDFGRTTNAIRSAEDAAEARVQDEKLAAILVAQNVRITFFLARTQRELVGVAETTLRNQQAHLDQIRGFVDVGKRPEVDLSQARADVANARVQLIQAKNGYATAKAQLDQAMGVTAPFPYEVASEALGPVEGENAALSELVDLAVAARPDLDSLAAQVRAQEASARSARGRYLPSLDANLSVTDQTLRISNLGIAGEGIDDLVPNASAALTLTWNLFEGGATGAAVREAEAQAAAISAQLESARQQVRVEVEQAQLSVHAALEALAAAQEAADAARDRLRLAEGRYQAGVGTALELSDAQSVLTGAEAQLVQAANAVSLARAQLLFALGRA